MIRDWRSFTFLSSLYASGGLIIASLALLLTGHFPSVTIQSQLAQVGGSPTTYYVSNSGDDTNPGTIDQPWKTFERAFDASKSGFIKGGDTLYIRSGTYRYDSAVYADLQEGWTSPSMISGSASQPTTIAGYPGERPVIYPSVSVTGWQQYTDRTDANIWVFDWKSYIRDNHPSMYAHTSSVTDSSSVWYGVPQLVAIDSSSPTLLQEVNSSVNAASAHLNPTDMNSELEIESLRTNQDDMIAGDFYYDKSTGKLYIWLPDNSDPNTKPIEVEMSTLFFVGKTEQHHVHVSNITLRYSGGGININGNDDVIDNVDSSYNAGSGIGNGLCNSCVYKNSILSHNGNSGATLGGDNSIIENILFEKNNYRKYASRWHCGGVKVVGGSGLTFRGNTFKDTIECPSLWFDTNGPGQLVEKNRFIGSGGIPTSLLFEATHGTAQNPNIIRNNIFQYTGGIFIRASNYNYIENNVFYRDGGVTVHGLGPGSDRYNANNNKIFNNIFYIRNFQNVVPEAVFIVQDAPAEYFTSGNVSDYNIFFPTSDARTFFGGTMSYGGGYYFPEWQTMGYDAHSRFIDPQLTDPENGNFMPKPGSPVIDAGMNTSHVISDFNGNSRPKDSDGDGNTTVDIGPYELPTITPPPPPVVIPPLAISSVRAQPYITTANIYWTTNIPANGQVEYGLTSSYGNTSTLDTSLGTSHSQYINGLVSNTTYHFHVISKTSTGTTTISSDQTFVTDSPPVVTPGTNSLAVNTLGLGQGSVISSPSGISCGVTCIGPFPINSDITITATPSVGSHIVSMGGCSVIISTTVCKVHMDRARTVAVNFDKNTSVQPQSLVQFKQPVTQTTQSTYVAPYRKPAKLFESNTSYRTSTKALLPDKIERNLKIGDTGDDVRLLQKILNIREYTVVETGVGSPGEEGISFDSATRDAVMRYQKDRLPTNSEISGTIDNLTLFSINNDIEKYINNHMEVDKPLLVVKDVESGIGGYIQKLFQLVFDTIWNAGVKTYNYFFKKL